MPQPDQRNVQDVVQDGRGSGRDVPGYCSTPGAVEPVTDGATDCRHRLVQDHQCRGHYGRPDMFVLTLVTTPVSCVVIKQFEY